MYHTTKNHGSAFLYIILCLSLLLLVILEFVSPSKELAQHEKMPKATHIATKTQETNRGKKADDAAKINQSGSTADTPIPAKKTPTPTSPLAKTIPPTTKPLPVAKITQTLAQPIPSTPLTSIESINASTRKAVVNIICTAKSGGVFKPVSGSGVIIDPRGVILTNAHLANVLLLKDYPSPGFIDCVVRTGSPARNTYRAELLYISSTWVRKNKNSIIEEDPTGTGQNDFALLRITEMVSPSEPLPATFPYIEYELEENSVQENQPIVIVAYPASFLGGITIQKDLHITSTVSTITKLYTFDQAGLLDLISVGTSILAQKGSSGGAVVRQQSAKLTALIVTSSAGETTRERELNAITIAHINRSLKAEMGFDLEEFLSTDLAAVAHDFQTIVAKGLTDILIDVVEK